MLISCPECSKQISDKVTVCPHCGYPFEEDDIQPEGKYAKSYQVKQVRELILKYGWEITKNE